MCCFTSIRTAALALLSAAVFAASPRANEVPIEHMRELLLTIEVRKVLLDDAELGPLNLGVKFEGRVATLWGPVPSPAIKRRAEEALKKFPYISDVRNQLHVPVDDITTFMPAHTWTDGWLKNESTTTPPAREPKAGGALAGQSTDETRRQEPERRSAYTAMSPKADLPTPVRPAVDLDSPEALQRKVVDLQRSNERYHGIRVRVLARDVFLIAESSRAAAMYEMAQTVRRLPGVAQVVVREQ
jgi:osmotically-inducible protein OsmY